MVESAAEIGAKTFGIDEALEGFDDGHPDPGIAQIVPQR